MDALIDAHSPFPTEEYVAAASGAGYERPEGMPRWAAWSVPEHLALMDQTGVRTSVLSLSAPGTHFGDDTAARHLTRHVNEFAIDLVHRYPGPFAHFPSLPVPDASGPPPEPAHAPA